MGSQRRISEVRVSIEDLIKVRVNDYKLDTRSSDCESKGSDERPNESCRANGRNMLVMGVCDGCQWMILSPREVRVD